MMPEASKTHNLQINLLGRVIILRLSQPVASRLSKKALALLAYLLAGPAPAYPRQELAGLFWGELEEDRAHYNLRRLLWSLRREINPPAVPHDVYVRFEDNLYYFDRSSDYWLDLKAFQQAAGVHSSYVAGPYSEPVPVLSPTEEETLSQVAALYRGEFMAGFRLADCPVFEDWLFLERDRLRLEYLQMLRLLLRASMRRRNYAQALEKCHQILALEPTDEATHRELMEIYAVTGNQAAALGQYRLLAQTLKTQLDLEPLTETRLLYESIRAGAVPVEGVTYQLDHPADPAGAALSTPFVGRNQEQAVLARALREAAHGRGAIVAVSGEAGVGKTRLMEECLRQATRSGATVLRARCYLQEESLPYQPIIDALRAYLPALDPLELVRLDGLWLAEVVKLLPELHQYLPHLPASPDLFPDQERNRLFEGVAQFLAHLSLRSPLVLFLDDLDFADASSLEMVHYLGRRLIQTTITMLLALRRTELIEESRLRNLLWSLERAGQLVVIQLDRFSREETASLIQQLVPEKETWQTLVNPLYAESGGNPFFLVELLHALQEGQNLSLESVTIPNRVREVIEGRLARLDPTSRWVLNTASVIGRQFDWAILQQIYSGDEEALLDALSSLLSRRWIENMPGSRTGLYDFSHGLVREVIYQLLSPERRRRLHQQVGLALEASGRAEGELAGLLAHHFWEGHDLERAQRYALLAAAYVRQLYANREAVEYYLRALQIPSLGGPPLPGPLYLQILLELGQVYQLLGEYQAAAETYQQNLPDEALQEERITETLSSPIRRRLCLQLALTYDRQGEYRQALTTLRQLENHVPDLNDPETQLERATIAWAMARVHQHREQSHQALALCNQALALLAGLEETAAVGAILTATYHTMARSYFHLGNYDISVAHYERAMAIARRLEQQAAIPRLLLGLGNVARRRGDYARAEKYARESLSLCREIGLVASVADSHGTLGNVAYNRGQLEEAGSHYSQALAIFRQLGVPHGIADYCLSLAFVLLDEDRVDEAETYLAEAYEIGQAIRSDLVLIRAYYHLAKVARARGEMELARTRVTTAIEIAEGAGIQLMRALSYRLLAEMLAQQHQPAQAEEHILESLRVLEKLGERFEVAWTLRSYAGLLVARGELDRAQALLQQAVTIFGELEAERELQKTNQVLLRLRRPK